MRDTQRNACVISETLLDATGSSIMAGDRTSFLACFRGKLEVVTDLGKRVVDDPFEHNETFDRVLWHYRASGVNRIERTLVGADFLDRNVILLAHESRAYCGEALTQKPFLTMSELHQIDGRWQIGYVNYAVQDSLRFNRALHGPNPLGNLKAARPKD